MPEYQPLVIGNYRLRDAGQHRLPAGRGNFVINEDGEGPVYATPRNNDIWACLDDGDDTTTSRRLREVMTPTI